MELAGTPKKRCGGKCSLSCLIVHVDDLARARTGMQGQKRRAREHATVGLLADACNQRACSVSDRTRKAEGPLTKGESDTPRKSIDPDSFKRLEFNSTGFELLKPPLYRTLVVLRNTLANESWIDSLLAHD